MPNYSETSKERLNTCNEDLIKVFSVVIEYFDNTIVCGHRNEAAQNKAFDEGKSKVRFPGGKHNTLPSEAVDAVPYPIIWDDRERQTLFAGFVLGIARAMYETGEIKHLIRWGGDWDKDTQVKDNNFDDLVHFELYKP